MLTKHCPVINRREKRCTTLVATGIFLLLILHFSRLLLWANQELFTKPDTRADPDNPLPIEAILSLQSTNREKEQKPVAVSRITAPTTTLGDQPQTPAYSKDLTLRKNNGSSATNFSATTSIPKADVRQNKNKKLVKASTNNNAIPKKKKPKGFPKIFRRPRSLEQGEKLAKFQAYETAPIISQSKGSPIRIRVLLFHQKRTRRFKFRDGPTRDISDEMLNICMDGFTRSPHFDFLGTEIIPDPMDNYVLKEENDVVWVVDMRRMVEGESVSIPEQLLQLINKTLDYQKTVFYKNKGIIPSLKAVFMDYRDKPYSLCRRTGGAAKKLVQLLGSNNVRRVSQQVVIGRAWDPEMNFPKMGNVVKAETCLGFALHVPYTVRSDYAVAIQSNYTSFLPPNTNGTTHMAVNRSNSPPDTVRPMDIAHFWPAQPERERFAKLRNAVTQRLLTLNATVLMSSSQPIRVMGDFVSSAGTVGRTKADSGYLEALLTTKIVVVAQRDGWEDHYRLFEAIAGGALVLTDPMHTLPYGYVNGTNILVYHTLEELERFVLHYLQHPKERLEIARKGWELAMSQHRTYHWMERLFYGKPLTP